MKIIIPLLVLTFCLLGVFVYHGAIYAYEMYSYLRMSSWEVPLNTEIKYFIEKDNGYFLESDITSLGGRIILINNKSNQLQNVNYTLKETNILKDSLSIYCYKNQDANLFEDEDSNKNGEIYEDALNIKSIQIGPQTQTAFLLLSKKPSFSLNPKSNGHLCAGEKVIPKRSMISLFNCVILIITSILISIVVYSAIINKLSFKEILDLLKKALKKYRGLIKSIV